MSNKYLVIGITGVTCGGKTTLSKKLTEQIQHHSKYSKYKINLQVLAQDDYFLDVADQRHLWVEEIQHIHFDVITSLDMDQMYKDILKIITNNQSSGDTGEIHYNVKEKNGTTTQQDNGALKLCFQNLKQNVTILILEGFSIYEHSEIFKLCDLKYFFTLDYEECKCRRSLRVYDPPDCEGYFEICVWPEYVKYLHLVQGKSSKTESSVTFFESDDTDRCVQVFDDIIKCLNNM